MCILGGKVFKFFSNVVKISKYKGDKGIKLGGARWRKKIGFTRAAWCMQKYFQMTSAADHR